MEQKAPKKKNVHGHARSNKKHFMYQAWARMRQRCTNKKTKDYVHYGGRGITICERWDNFKNFLNDMGERPEGYSLDRIDNSKGYSPENCRWSSQRQQILNSRLRKNKTSIFRGVSFQNGKWKAKCASEYVGIYKREKDAASVYNKMALIKFGHEANLNIIEDS
jgi:hypothetical protein